MRFITYGSAGAEMPGLVDDQGRIAPLAPALKAAGIRLVDPVDLIAIWPAVQPIAESVLASDHRIDFDSVRVGSPVPRPGKVIAIGFNYPTHGGPALGPTTSGEKPVLFLKPPSSVVGPADDVVLPLESTQVDYELELAIVIGLAGRRIPRAAALDHVFGYTVANDVTARDVVFAAGLAFPMQLQIARGKGYDTFCPLGPVLVTRDEVLDPNALDLRLSVNGDLRQDSNTSTMTVDVAGLIASVSEAMELNPGDVILTGTPDGCGFLFDPPRFLADGDVVSQSISGIGAMEFSVRSERISGAAR